MFRRDFMTTQQFKEQATRDAKVLKYARKISFLRHDEQEGTLHKAKLFTRLPADDAQLLERVSTKTITLRDEGETDIDPTHLTPTATFETKHSYGHPMWFKPTIAEIIDQLPEEALRGATAISIHPASRDTVVGTTEDGCHRGIATVYSGEVKGLRRRQSSGQSR
jgi:hypothetical protein